MEIFANSGTTLLTAFAVTFVIATAAALLKERR